MASGLLFTGFALIWACYRWYSKCVVPYVTLYSVVEHSMKIRFESRNARTKLKVTTTMAVHRTFGFQFQDLLTNVSSYYPLNFCVN